MKVLKKSYCIIPNSYFLNDLIKNNLYPALKYIPLNLLNLIMSPKISFN